MSAVSNKNGKGKVIKPVKQHITYFENCKPSFPLAPVLISLMVLILIFAIAVGVNMAKTKKEKEKVTESSYYTVENRIETTLS